MRANPFQCRILSAWVPGMAETEQVILNPLRARRRGGVDGLARVGVVTLVTFRAFRPVI